jgi:hypothetical protein
VLAKRKGASQEGWSEGSVEQNCDPTNRNRIQGDAGRTSWLETAKSSSIKALRRRSGGCAAKAVELTPGDLCRCPMGLGLIVRWSDRGTEVSRGQSSHEEAGSGEKTRRTPEGSRGEGPKGPREGVEWRGQ